MQRALQVRAEGLGGGSWEANWIMTSIFYVFLCFLPQIRLIVICIVGPFSLCLGIIIGWQYLRARNLIFRTVGANIHLQGWLTTDMFKADTYSKRCHASAQRCWPTTEVVISETLQYKRVGWPTLLSAIAVQRLEYVSTFTVLY